MAYRYIGAAAIVMGVTASAATLQTQTTDQLGADATRAANRGEARAIGVPVMALPADRGITGTIAQWKAIAQTDALPFDSYAGFLLAHPGWPQQATNRRAAEKKAATGSPASVVRFFATFPPQSATGGVAHARALAALGRTSEANEAAASAWRRGALSIEDEAIVRTQFAGALRPADHDRRMDALLWQGGTAAAQRQLSSVSPAARPLFETRLAFRTNAPAASTLAATNDAAGLADAGYIADKATWLRGSGASPGARYWLARIRPAGLARPGDVEKFYEVLLTNARGAAADRQWQVAYDIARQIDDAYPAGTDVSQKPYGERDDYTSLAWLAGRTAMDQLARPADAATMFDRYGRGSQSPQTRAKGFYWAGRAMEAAGRREEANAFLTRAAGYRDQYYGQLANERLVRPLVAPPAVAAIPVPEQARRAFYARETVRAAQLLGQIGQWQDQTQFVRQIAADAATDTDHILAKELSRTMNRPDLGVMVGRSAMQNGLADYSAAGFPTVAVPAGHEGQWTMIHAISRQESQFDRMAMSAVGARGLMQLMPGTAREVAGRIGLPYDSNALTADPLYNVQLGSSYFQRVYASYGSYPLAVAAYNAGPGNVNKWLRENGDPRLSGGDWVMWIERIPYSETRNYVQRVLENAVVYDLMNPARARSRGPANLSWYIGKGQPG